MDPGGAHGTSHLGGLGLGAVSVALERDFFACCFPSRSLPMVVTVLTMVEMCLPTVVLA